jgi:hypothetical protein
MGQIEQVRAMVSPTEERLGPIDVMINTPAYSHVFIS